MSYYKSCLLAVCLGYSLLANAQVDTLIRLTPDQRVIQLWVHVLQDGDNLFTTHRIDSVQVLARQWGDERLYWYTNLIQILHRAGLENKTNKPMTAFATAEPSMEQCPVPTVRAAYYCFYGQQYFIKREFDKGFTLMFRAKSMFEKIGYATIPEAPLYLTIFGHYYYSFEDYKKALYYLELAKSYPNYLLRTPYTDMNTVGMAYQRLREYSKAAATFQRVIASARSYHNTDYVGIGSGNLGNTLRLMGKNRQALPYLYTDLRLNEKTIPANSAITCLYIAKALMALDSTAKAKTYIDRSSHLTPDWVWSSYPLNYYEALTLYYKKTANYPKASAYLDSTIALKDSLRAVFSDRILATAESSVKAGQYLSDIEQAETEKKFVLRERNLILAAMLLLALASMYAISQNRQKLRQEKQILAEQHKQAEIKLAYAQEQLGQYLVSIKEKNDLINQISLELDTARKILPNQSPFAMNE